MTFAGNLAVKNTSLVASGKVVENCLTETWLEIEMVGLVDACRIL